MLLMYNVGVFGGACCFFVVDPHATVVGMSGGCYSLIGMQFADLIMNWHQKKFRRPTVFFLLLLVGVDVASYNLAVSSESASHAAHLGGVVAGLLIGVLVGENMKVKKIERVIQAVVLFVGLVLLVFSLSWMGANEAPKTLWESDGWCWTRQVYSPTRFGNDWECVRCGNQECIASFDNEPHITTVKPSECNDFIMAR